MLPRGNGDGAAFLFQDDQLVLFTRQDPDGQDPVRAIEFDDRHASSRAGEYSHFFGFAQEHAASLRGDREDGRGRGRVQGFDAHDFFLVPEFHEFSTQSGRGLLKGVQVKAHAHAGRGHGDPLPKGSHVGSIRG